MITLSHDLIIDVDVIMNAQDKYYSNILSEIERILEQDEQYDFHDDLSAIIENETKKYASSIERDCKIPRKKLPEYFVEFNTNIYTFMKSEIRKQDFDLESCIKTLNKNHSQMKIFWINGTILSTL